MDTTRPYTKLTANVSMQDILFIDENVRKGNFANRTDFTREAIRCLRRNLETHLSKCVKVEGALSSSACLEESVQ